MSKLDDIKCPRCAGPTMEKETCFEHCVKPRDCNPASHGNITVTQTCKDCGTYRRINVNNRHIEKGPWNEGPWKVCPWNECEKGVE